MKRSLLFVLSLCLFSLFFVLVKGERGTRLDIRQKGESFIEGLKIVNRRNGSRIWTLFARRADITENGERAYLTDIEMKIEDRGITVKAEKGLYGMTDKKLIIDGKAVARGDSYSITADKIELDSGGGNLKSDGDVFIEGRKFNVRGKGMYTDSAVQKVRILRDVEAVFYH